MPERERERELLRLRSENRVLRNHTRYGLNWERKHEQVIDSSLNLPGSAQSFPVIERVSELDVNPLGGTNPNLPDNSVVTMIEGDNYDALLNLQYTHKGKIDLIYIDPPYNTGNDDFVYDDKRVDKEDSFRHSKWLSFMAPRLVLAKDLLSKEGFIFVSIGEDEHSNLELLLDKVFGDLNKIGNVSRIQKTSSAKGEFFRPTKDYLLVYKSDNSSRTGFSDEREASYEKQFKEEDSKGRYKTVGLYQAALDSRPNQRYWIECPDGSFCIPPGNSFPEEITDAAFIKPKDNRDKVWRWSYASYLEKKDSLVFKKTNNSPLLDQYGKPSKYNVYVKQYLSDSLGKSIAPRDYIEETIDESINDSSTLNAAGTRILKEMNVAGDFSFPKPVGLIRKLLKWVGNEEAKILDFFAGSGTTAHAVLALNAEDGGNRECIIVTNNEGGEENERDGIARSVCYQRIKKVIEGYEKQTGKKEKVAGLGGSLEYWRTGERRPQAETEDDWLELADNLDVLSLKEEMKFVSTSEEADSEQLILSDQERSITISDQEGSDYILSLNSKAEKHFPGEMIAAYQAAIEVVEEIYLDPLERYFTDGEDLKDIEGNVSKEEAEGGNDAVNPEESDKE